MGRFLARTDRGIVTIQSVGVEVPESDLIPGLAIAKAGVYQVWLCSATQDVIKITITAYSLPADASTDGLPGEIVCDRPVDFYDEAVYIDALTAGVQGQFTLPEGEGQYRVIVTTDRDTRTEMSRLVTHGTVPDDDFRKYLERLAEYDGREWYGVYFQFIGPVSDDEDYDV